MLLIVFASIIVGALWGIVYGHSLHTQQMSAFFTGKSEQKSSLIFFYGSPLFRFFFSAFFLGNILLHVPIIPILVLIIFVVSMWFTLLWYGKKAYAGR